METPSFTFRLERVRTLRERAEERARGELATELRARLKGEAMLKQAVAAVSSARTAGRGAGSITEMRAAQAYLERTEQVRATAELDLARQDAEVAIRREALAAAARDRQAIDKLKQRQQADHEVTWARRAQNQLDELALAVHRRGGAVAV